jgi:hypothetical protein
MHSLCFCASMWSVTEIFTPPGFWKCWITHGILYYSLLINWVCQWNSGSNDLLKCKWHLLEPIITLILHNKIPLLKHTNTYFYFLFQLNVHNMLNTQIHTFIICNLLHVSVFVTPSSVRPLHYLLKNCMLFAMLLQRLCYRI